MPKDTSTPTLRAGTTVAAPLIWAAYLRQQTIAPIVNLVGCLVWMSLGAGVLYRWWQWASQGVAREKAKAERASYGVGEEYVFGAIVLGCLSVFALGLLITRACDAALHLLNPDYYAIDALLRAMRGGK